MYCIKHHTLLSLWDSVYIVLISLLMKHTRCFPEQHAYAVHSLRTTTKRLICTMKIILATDTTSKYFHARSGQTVYTYDHFYDDAEYHFSLPAFASVLWTLPVQPYLSLRHVAGSSHFLFQEKHLFLLAFTVLYMRAQTV